MCATTATDSVLSMPDEFKLDDGTKRSGKDLFQKAVTKVCMNEHMYVSIYLCVYMYVCVCVCVCECVYIYMYIYIYMYMYIYIYVHIHMYTYIYM